MTIKRFFALLTILLLLSGNAYAVNYVDTCHTLTGGVTGSLDNIDGSTLSDGDRAIVTTDGVSYEYRLDASSGAAESSPSIISPDTNAGTKRWLLQGWRMATLQLASGATPTEFSTDGTLGGNSDTAIPTEKAVKTYVDALSGLSAASVPGYVNRTRFIYKDTDEIYLDPAAYNHNGTSEQIVYWDSQLTYQFASTSNSTWHYLYLDDSAIVTAGTNVISATELTHSTTAPSWTAAKHGFYSGSDRCIGAFLTDASGNILEFWHNGGDLLTYADAVEDRAAAALAATTWTAVTLTAPNFGDNSRALCAFLFWDAASTSFYYRKTGSTATTGQWLAQTASGAVLQSVTVPVSLNGSQQIDIYADAAASGVTIKTCGYYLPIGM